MENTKSTNIRWSSKSWYYKLVKFVFGNSLPDLTSFKNSCPIFWIIIASMFASIFVGPVKFIGYVIYWLNDKIDDSLSESRSNYAELWLKNLTPYEVCDYVGEDDLRVTQKPILYKHIYSDALLRMWAETHGYDINITGWRQILINDLHVHLVERRKLCDERDAKIIEAHLTKQAKQQLVEDRLQKIQNALDLSKFKSGVTQMKNYNTVIRYAKNFIGALITSILVFVLYFSVQGIAWLVSTIVNNWNTVTEMDLLFLMMCGVIVLLVIILYYINKLIKYYIQKVKSKGKPSWFMYPFIWLYYTIFYTLKVIIWYPIYYILYVGFVRFLIIGFLWGIIKGFGKGFVNSAGVFGDYFSQSKGDYCPGAEWDK